MPQWLIDFLGDVTLAQVVIWVVIVCGLFVALRKAWPGLKAMVALADMIETLLPMMQTLKGIPVFQQQTTSMLARLRSQVENSHDTNLRDELTEALELAKTTAAAVDGLQERLASIELAQHGQTKALEDVQSKLTSDHKRITFIEETIPRENAGHEKETP